ncbi:hypothetical protein ACN38_g10703 [Penicillium nordicum]|uniref:Uncharacterized protein n=1 Tax=Penicillium nordicum TaxID=229535 RepID=A0A0M8NW05_9EURO|nr:hypothetical protein ACN38_g10703 [Penicillium nordicum]
MPPRPFFPRAAKPGSKDAYKKTDGKRKADSLTTRDFNLVRDVPETLFKSGFITRMDPEKPCCRRFGSDLVKVCRKCAIIDSHLGSMVDTRVTCRRYGRINLPVCSSLQALLWLSTVGGVRHQVTRLRGAKTGDQICRPPTSNRGAGLAPLLEIT